MGPGQEETEGGKGGGQVWNISGNLLPFYRNEGILTIKMFRFFNGKLLGTLLGGLSLSLPKPKSGCAKRSTHLKKEQMGGDRETQK